MIHNTTIWLIEVEASNLQGLPQQCARLPVSHCPCQLIIIDPRSRPTFHPISFLQALAWLLPAGLSLIRPLGQVLGFVTPLERSLAVHTGSCQAVLTLQDVCDKQGRVVRYFDS